MKVLQFTKFYSPVHGGIETATYELAQGMAARGIECSVLCSSVDRHSKTDVIDGIQVRRSGSLGKLLSTSVSPRLIWDLLRVRHAYDVIHVHLPNPMANLALLLVRPNAKLILHWHSDIINQARALRLYEPLQRWLLKRADAIIATSPPYAEFSAALRPYLSKVHVVPLGINTAQLPAHTDDRSAERRKLFDQYGDRKIVFAVGRMASYKGFDQLVEAAGYLNQDAIVLVAGGGELLQQHRQQVRLAGMESKIVFLGRVTDAQMAALLDEASVFCLPSTNRAEAFGMVLLEAMAASLPIVATDIQGSGVPWVNQHDVTGFNVPVNSPRALANAINRLLSDPDLARRMGAEGRQRFNRHFVASRMVDQTLDVYRSLLFNA